MVLYGFLEISKTVIDVAKITVRFSFSCSVSQFFRNFEVSFMVLYGFLENVQNCDRRCQDYSTLFFLLPCLLLLSKF